LYVIDGFRRTVVLDLKPNDIAVLVQSLRKLFLNMDLQMGKLIVKTKASFSDDKTTFRYSTQYGISFAVQLLLQTLDSCLIEKDLELVEGYIN
jgi:hypothetical protein